MITVGHSGLFLLCTFTVLAGNLLTMIKRSLYTCCYVGSVWSQVRTSARNNQETKR